MIEQTLVLLKPDAVQRGLVGEILSRFERVGLKIVGMKLVQVDAELAKKHYPDALIPIVGGKTKKDWDAYGIKYTESVEDIGKMIINATRKFIQQGPVIAVVLEGLHAPEIVRKLVGTTGPKDSPPGTIRGDFAHLSLGYASTQKKGAANLIHASGNSEEAKKEIELWFKKSELFKYPSVHDVHVLYAPYDL
ncbi:Nucleoside diphosphate kinase [uncultured archaeon]|nr:Nucleoside diphosphate kinase [uncultured archaeon]